MSFSHLLRWSYFFLHGHANMVYYINRVPNSESRSRPSPHALFGPVGSSVSHAAATTQVAPQRQDPAECVEVEPRHC